METFTRHTETVGTIPDAFTFIMGLLDTFPHPSVEIRAWTTEEGIQLFDVTVSGTL